jgi:cyclohexadieny/prephenate dehydrogenase
LLIATRVHGGFNRAVLFRKIALVGVGLLGGSLALAIRERRLAAVVQGYVRRKASIAECERAGLADFATTDLTAAVRDADLIILCTPLAQMRGLTENLLPSLKKGALVSDVGSVKASVVADLEKLVADAGGHFVGAHPMAGGEQPGVSAARVDLFSNAVCVITPTAATNATALQQIEEFWRALGTRLLKLTPQLHDELVARSSHLPHSVAAVLAGYVLKPEHPKEQPQLCATGFRDTTRVASGSPEMWRDIALANREPLSHALAELTEQLQHLQRAISAGDAAAIEKFFTTAKQRRDGWCGQSALT